MQYYDCHTHINHDPLVQNADTIAEACLKQGIILNDVGTNLETSALAIAHAQKHENVYAIVGIHPNDTHKTSLSLVITQLTKWVLNKKNKIVAIGETGLDYHYSDTNKEQQKLFFIKHIEIAKEFNLPLMVHVRDAHDDAIDVLTKYATGIKVIIHCYSGDRELVEKYTRLGFYISIPGIITFRNALLLKDAIKAIPPQLLLSETDAPWLTPEPYRGKTNSPLYVPFVIKAMAKILNIDENILQKQIYTNTINLFKVSF